MSKFTYTVLFFRFSFLLSDLIFDMDFNEFSASDENRAVESNSGFVWVNKISRSYNRLVSLCYNKGRDAALMNWDDRYLTFFFLLC